MATPAKKTASGRSAGSKPVSTGEIGSSGLNAQGGYVNEEHHPNLAGRRALQVFSIMRENDPMIGATLFAIDNLIRQVKWTVNQNDAKQEHADFLQSVMDDMSMSWGDVVSEALSMLPFGFAPMEIIYKQRNGTKPPDDPLPASRYDDGKIGWRNIALRAQETLLNWDIDDNGSLRGMVQQAPPKFDPVTIPIEKMLLFRTTVHKNNPEGRSIFRNAYRPWFYKVRMEEVEGTGVERDLAGFPTFWLPAEYLADDATPEQIAVRQAFMDLGEKIRRDKQEFMIMPMAYDDAGNKMFDFTLLNSGGTRTFDTSAIIQRYEQRIAMTMLGDFILMGHEKVGSFALSSDKTDLFAYALGTFLDIIADTFNRFAVPRLFELNNFPLDHLPTIEHSDIESPDLTDLGTYLASLAQIGMPLFPDEDLENYLRIAGNMPEKSEATKLAQQKAAEEAQQQAQETARQAIATSTAIQNGKNQQNPAGGDGGGSNGPGGSPRGPRPAAGPNRNGRATPPGGGASKRTATVPATVNGSGQ